MPPSKLVVNLLACVLGAGAAGCATDAPGVAPSPAASSSEAGTDPTSDQVPDPSTAPAPSDAPDASAARIRLTEVGSGFEQPVALVVSPGDGELLVVEQPGRLTTLDGDVRLDLEELTLFGGERGLLDAEAHPDGGRIFVHHSGRDGATILAEYPVASDGSIDAGGRVVLFTTPQPAANHNGGSIAFAPDGTLVLALGDGGRAGDAFDQAQDTTTPLGGLLRFDVSTPGEARPAAGNPFPEPRLWMYGLRNPWRIAFDGDRLFVADVGQDAVEEVSVVAADAVGANFGWPSKEGDTCFAESPCEGDFVPPIVTEDHADGSCSITGGIVHRGSAVPELVGTYLYSDVCGGYLRGVVTDGLDVVATVDLTDQVDVAQVVGFDADADGETYLLQLTGEVLRIDPA